MNLLLGAALLLLGGLTWWNFRTAVTLVVFLIPAYLLRTSLVGLSTNAWELCVVVVGLVSLLRPARRAGWRELAAHVPRDVAVTVALFISAAVATTVISDELRVSLGILKGWVIIPLVFAGVVATTLTTAADRERIVRALLWSGVVSAVVGLWQARYLERISSFYDVPNSLALWLAPLLIIALWQALSTHTFWYWFVSSILGVTLLLTQSVSGLAAVLVVVGLMSVQFATPVPRRVGRRLVVGGVIVSLAFLYSSGRLGYFVTPLKTGAATSVSVRGQLWSIASELVLEHPVLGIGLGQFEPHYQLKLHHRFAQYAHDPTRSRQPLPEFVFRDPHNWVLSFWLNVGLVGLVSFSYLHLRAVRSLLTTAPPNGVVRGVQWALVALLLFGLVDTIYWKNDLAALQWLLLALLI